MAKFYKTNGESEDVYPKNGKTFTLEELQNFIREGDEKIIDIVYLPSGDQMVVNDMGVLLRLPKNEKATEIWIKEFPKDVYPFNNGGLVVGNVLVAKKEEMEDEESE